MAKIMAVYDSDVMYATRFMEYFRKRTEYDFDIMVFTHQESLKEYLTHHKIDVLLMGDELDITLVRDSIPYIYQLKENASTHNDEEYPFINKYQSAQSVMRDIMNDLRQREKPNYWTDTKKILTIYSTSTDLNSVLFGWSLSILLAEREKTLYIPLELFSISLLSFIQNENPNLSDFIYYLKENNPNLKPRFTSLLQQYGNLSYLNGITHGLDVQSINKDDICRLVEELKTQTDYQTIVFYLGCYNEAMLELMRNSDKMFLICSKEPYHRLILNGWLRQQERMDSNTFLHNYQKLLFDEEMQSNYPISLQELRTSRSWTMAKSLIQELYQDERK
jgi:hypothetical protein